MSATEAERESDLKAEEVLQENDAEVELAGPLKRKLDKSTCDRNSDGDSDAMESTFTDSRDPFAARDKISILNVPWFWDKKELIKWLASLEVTEFHKAVKIPNEGRAMLSFDDEESLKRAKAKIRGQRIKDRSILVKVLANTSRVPPEPERKKGAVPVDDTEEQVTSFAKDVVDVTTPLYKKVPYEDQLKLKEKKIVAQCYRKIVKGVGKVFRQRIRELKRCVEEPKSGKVESLPEWLEGVGKKIPWETAHIVRSPVTAGYRNNCEFSIGPNKDGIPTVGFRLGKFRGGSVLIGEVDDCVVVSEPMKKICKQMQEFIRSSPLATYNLMDHTGVWRQLSLRQSYRHQDVLACVMVSHKELNVEEEWAPELQRLVSFLRGHAASLCLQVYDGLSSPSPDHPVSSVFGLEAISDRVLGVDFRISAMSFFQVNTVAAEVLYQTVVDCARIDADSLLIDVCCGTGAIGLCCAKISGCQVFGIELVQAAVDDARANAEMNGIKNVEFVCDSMEVALPEALKRFGDKEAVVVVDPPRSGLHRGCLRSIRSAPSVKRIVYVSCNPIKSLPDDVVFLCCPTSKRYGGHPFKPTRSVPVDMFPHTEHCELVMVLER